MTPPIEVELTVNGTAQRLVIEPRRVLADVLREDLGLTGTNLGCEHGVCGSCTVLLDGEPVRSCLVLAVQVRSERCGPARGAPRRPPSAR